MKKIILPLILCVFSIGHLFAQDSRYPQWTAAEVAKANTAKGTSLTQEEKNVIYLMNLARLNGTKFRDTYAKGYLGNKSSSYISSLYSDLSRVSNLPMLVPETYLTKAAAAHAKEMGSSGQVSHNSLDGTDCFTRIRNNGYRGNALGENCSYGESSALGIVMQLLVDEGVSGVGHRKNILGSEYKCVGVAIRSHSYYGTNCVQDFGDNINSVLSGGVSNNSNNNSYNNNGYNNNSYNNNGYNNNNSYNNNGYNNNNSYNNNNGYNNNNSYNNNGNYKSRTYTDGNTTYYEEVYEYESD